MTPNPVTVSTAEELLELALDYENGLAAETSAQWRKTALYLREYAALLVIESGRTHWEECWRDPKHHACAVAKKLSRRTRRFVS